MTRRARLLWEERARPVDDMRTRVKPVSVQQAAEWLGCHPATVRRMLKLGLLRGGQVGAGLLHPVWNIDPRSVAEASGCLYDGDTPTAPAKPGRIK